MGRTFLTKTFEEEVNWFQFPTVGRTKTDNVDCGSIIDRVLIDLMSSNPDVF